MLIASDLKGIWWETSFR